MRPDLEPVVEQDAEVLADGVDARDRGAHDPLGARPRLAGRRRGDGPAEQMRSEPGGRAVEGVALRHQVRPPARARSRVAGAPDQAGWSMTSSPPAGRSTRPR